MSIPFILMACLVLWLVLVIPAAIIIGKFIRKGSDQ